MPDPPIHGLDPAELFARALETARPSTGASAWTPPTPEELARLLPQYCIESLLGHGGMGAVYKGWQPALERPVAIKLLPAEIARDPEFVARFQREARTLARLQHPGIVAVYGSDRTSEGHLYFVMEYIDGTDLQKILQNLRLNPARALEAICQICDALHYAHRQGVVHRDIKPSNILFTLEGQPKIADFGLARPISTEGAGLTQTHAYMGTPGYMAPEQQSGQADQRADIYALGVMLYEMLTGQHPKGIFQMPSQRVRVDVRIDEVIIKALQQEPERRYQRVSDMKTDVDRIRATPLQGTRQEPIAPSRRWRLPTRLWNFVPAAIILVLLGVIAYLASNEHRAINTARKSPATPSSTSLTRPSSASPARPPIASPPPATPSPIRAQETPAPVDDRAAFEREIRSYAWQGRMDWVILFKDNHLALVREGDRIVPWHWWVVAPRTLHVQYAAMPATFNPEIGSTWHYDQGASRMMGEQGEPGPIRLPLPANPW